MAGSHPDSLALACDFSCLVSCAGAKNPSIFRAVTARLKSCPDTKYVPQSLHRSLLTMSVHSIRGSAALISISFYAWRSSDLFQQACRLYLDLLCMPCYLLPIEGR